MSESPRLSVIMPVYNEEGAIVAAVDEVKQCVLELVPASELVVVDDGSRDGTGAFAGCGGGNAITEFGSSISQTAVMARRC